MIDLSSIKNYYIACGYTDLRRGIDGLAQIVTLQYGYEINENSLFPFCGCRTDRIKALWFSGDGFVLLYKRLNNGHFQWPRSKDEMKLLTPQAFRWLMEGLSIKQKSIAELERENSMLKAEVESLRTKLDHMNEILLNMQRARFGQSSEKRKYVSPDQLSVFNEAELEQDPKAPEPDEKTIIVSEHKRKPKGSLEDKIKELPSEDVFLDIPEDEKVV